ncbi:uncharacterized protein IUM83_08514 [Phytophthora cinnamomi]|uniref:uncharacterized protein n=1 Tax=Phytophthora cinnamomi TaxID=4785 RepID=UPI003559886C|nr:hypothetical protein IUM83_08514 [Phytophthora cinnamomi]
MLGSRMEQVANALVTEAMMDGKLQMLAKNLFDSVVDYTEKLLPRRDPPASPSMKRDDAVMQEFGISGDEQDDALSTTPEQDQLN